MDPTMRQNKQVVTHSLELAGMSLTSKVCVRSEANLELCQLFFHMHTYLSKCSLSVQIETAQEFYLAFKIFLN